jgi:integrase/recombinase XerD
MPDRRTTAGKRDLGLLHLLGTAGLRRAEACALLIGDVDERRRAHDVRLRRAIPRSTAWWVTVQYGERGRRRSVPLEPAALDAITAWVKVRPACAYEQLFVSLPRTGRPSGPLGVRDVTRIVTRYAKLADLPEDRRSPHVFRRTFCTNLAAGASRSRSFVSSPGRPTSARPRSTPRSRRTAAERDRQCLPPPARPRPDGRSESRWLGR